MSNDPQDAAESVDEDVVGRPDRILSDEAVTEFPPEAPVGVHHADADVSDESFAERTLQEEPEVWETATPPEDDDATTVPAEEQLDTIIEP